MCVMTTDSFSVGVDHNVLEHSHDNLYCLETPTQIDCSDELFWKMRFHHQFVAWTDLPGLVDRLKFLVSHAYTLGLRREQNRHWTVVIACRHYPIAVLR